MGFAGRVSALLLFLVAGAVASDQIFTASGAKPNESTASPMCLPCFFHELDSRVNKRSGCRSILASCLVPIAAAFLPRSRTL